MAKIPKWQGSGVAGHDDRLAMKNLEISWPWPWFAKDFSDSLALVCPQPRDLPAWVLKPRSSCHLVVPQVPTLKTWGKLVVMSRLLLAHFGGNPCLDPHPLFSDEPFILMLKK
jgi:hypothetical protein